MSEGIILIVEDEAIVAADLAGKLQRLGYDVAGAAADGEQAVAMALRFRPHLILMDVRLGSAMDGIEAAEAIRRRHDVPVIYLTAHSDADTLARAKLTGPFGYILKPFEERELAIQIELALSKHRAEQEVRRQREWLHVTLRSIGDAVIATDASGRVGFVNPVAETLTGWKAEEAAGQPVASVFRTVNEETGEALPDPVARVLAEAPSSAVTRHAALARRDGRTVPIEESARPILDAAGTVLGAVLVFHDVTEKRRAGERLRQSEERYRLLFDRNPDAVFTVDATGRFVLANPACELISGYSVAELQEKTFVDLCAPDELAHTSTHFQRGVHDRVYAQFETALIRKDGRRVDVWIAGEPIVSDGRVVSVHCTAKDITDRKRAERALRQSEERYRTLFHSIDEGFCVIEVLFDDSQVPIDYRFLEVNPVFVKHTGIENAVGRRIRQLYPNLEQHWFDIYGRVARSGEAARFQSPAGQLGRFYDVYAFRFGEPEQRRVAVLFNDITNRKRAEEELQELNETLEAQVAERTAIAERRARDLRRLAAELSEAEHRERRRLAKLLHDDLQQSLLAVRLRLPVFFKEAPPELKQHVEKLDQLLVECTETSRNLTRELSPPILQLGTLGEILAWLAEWFGHKHGLAVSMNTRGEIPPAPEHLRIFFFQSVQEMLFNAVKHSGSMEANVEVFSEPGCLAVQVSDGGTDFDPEAAESRLQRPEGFGLFNIQERLDALGGRLEIGTAPRGGARFRMIVPLGEDNQPPLAVVAGAETSASRTGRKARPQGRVFRLLVVDDHAVVREGLIGLLNQQPDFQVVGEAHDGEHAIQQAEALLPDAILMDVDMPNMNGIEATRQIKQRQPETTIVALSFHDAHSAGRAMVEAGADAYVSKHADAKEVVDPVRLACRRDGAAISQCFEGDER